MRPVTQQNARIVKTRNQTKLNSIEGNMDLIREQSRIAKSQQRDRDRPLTGLVMNSQTFSRFPAAHQYIQSKISLNSSYNDLRNQMNDGRSFQTKLASNLMMARP